ncbi:rho GTPase-activating protein 29-like [Colius striatus]|uniref:rho GTPase-activating protein 29-like n=1 Tax=Colius striatus TaxID=57412 RepID=UPI002B1E8851|nr:rho GTPase-activating protein 29-like [Colius striatus]XP_061853589.1 rho GTPase-activating protein 29-like [Colius striatus]
MFLLEDPLPYFENGDTRMTVTEKCSPGAKDPTWEAASSAGPFRSAAASKATRTHQLRKLRAPAKCTVCGRFVVLHGAECEKSSLVCHKKCLAALAIQCVHKKLGGRLRLFGVELAQAAQNVPDGIPFIIRACASKTESRVLDVEAIRRVCGAKSRVEKLCWHFEKGRDLVELSEGSAHDISGVLKAYLHQNF